MSTAIPTRRLVRGKEPTIAVGGFKMKLLNDSERYCNGHLLMTFADTHAIARDEKGGVIASVGQGIGGLIMVEFGRRAWIVSPEELYRAVREADAAQYPPKEEQA